MNNIYLLPNYQIPLHSHRDKQSRPYTLCQAVAPAAKRVIGQSLPMVWRPASVLCPVRATSSPCAKSASCRSVPSVWAHFKTIYSAVGAFRRVKSTQNLRFLAEKFVGNENNSTFALAKTKNLTEFCLLVC